MGGCEVRLGGHTEQVYTDEAGRYRVRWVPAKTVVGVPYDYADASATASTRSTRCGCGAREATEAFDSPHLQPRAITAAPSTRR